MQVKFLDVSNPAVYLVCLKVPSVSMGESETDDLFSSRIWIRGKRMAVAFGLKGKGTKGKLTPKKMRKHGDQIQRLFRSPADVFIVQYWNEVDSSIYELMKPLAHYKSFAEGRPIYYGVIDGADSQRLIKAYGKFFPQM